ncbi:MAG: hypothetical protein H7210_12165 [Pyrinomonadaceae bacterium]|nr:hypothetical protein [Phycisphaerales bacterium]
MAISAENALVKRLRDLQAARQGSATGGFAAAASLASGSNRTRSNADADLAGVAPPSDLVTQLAALALTRTRQDRVKPSRDLSLAEEIDTQARLIRSVQKGIAKVSIAWDQILAGSGLPDELLARATVKSYRRGVLTIRVRDSTTQYLLARFLRAGGESRLARLAPVVVSRVKLVM